MSFGDKLAGFAYGGKQVAAKVTKKAKPKKAKAKPKSFDHLKPLTPLLEPGLRLVFVGFNPGVMTAETGHHYAHPTNLFWPLLYESGCVPEPMTAYDDRQVMERFRIGFTDLVLRPTTGVSDLTPAEMARAVPELESRIAMCSPKAMCLVGKGIWQHIYKAKYGRALPRDFEFGRQVGESFGSCDVVFVLPSTSGLVAGYSRNQKLQWFEHVGRFLADQCPLEPEQ